MMHRESTPPLFSDKEAALILRRAAELQESSGAPPRHSGFSLTELQEIAREAGIDPARVEEEAAFVASSPTDGWTRLLGSPTRLRYTRTLATPVPETRWSALVEEIRAVMGQPGTTAHLPGSLEWRVDSVPAVQVRVTTEGERTQVDARANLREYSHSVLFGSTAGGLLMGVLVGGLGFGLGPGAEMVGTMAGGAAGGLGVGWAVWRPIARRWQERLGTLVSQLSRTVQEESGER